MKAEVELINKYKIRKSVERVRTDLFTVNKRVTVFCKFRAVKRKCCFIQSNKLTHSVNTRGLAQPGQVLGALDEAG